MKKELKSSNPKNEVWTVLRRPNGVFFQRPMSGPQGAWTKTLNEEQFEQHCQECCFSREFSLTGDLETVYLTVKTEAERRQLVLFA